MAYIWTCIAFVLLLGIVPEAVLGLEANEGETLTLTCPRPSLSRPVIWEGPPNFRRYTRRLEVDIDLSSDQRSRISVTGDHSDGYYNLQLLSVKKSDSGEYRCRIGSRTIRSITLTVKTQAEQNQGLFPYILNLATRARISTNATCGEDKPEYFCKLVEHVDLMPQISHCDYCNARAGSGRLDEIGTAHPISNAIDGSNRWWQSPSITNGREYNYVTITLDLGLIYQVAYVIVKAANAPRPGNWILEKSVDGIDYKPWQYFAINDDDCERLYGVKAVIGKPSYDYLRDDEVRCTSYFSKLNPLENGEIFISLTNGRPGIFVPSKTLLDFTSARYVRLSLQKIRTLNADLMSLRSRDPRNLDPSVTRRYFYSVKDISIGGQCICYGHATECQRRGDSDSLACVCQHNTCGNNCEKCCPLFNQKPWVRGGGTGVNGQGFVDVTCEACNCHGHADACEYNATVDALGLSMNMDGEMKGGGVCIDCKDFTTGINCERCLPGYYRPFGVSHNSRRPCRPCNCEESIGSTGICVVDDSRVDEGLMPGSCICKEGYGGQNCDRCDLGYHSYPYCEPCTCSIAGTVDPNQCEGRCVCKENVDGMNCDQCKPGFYDLSVDNEEGCRQCFCFGISTVCQSAGLGLVQITDMRDSMDGWTVITYNDEGFTYFPTRSGEWLEYRTFPASRQNTLDTDRSVRDEVLYYWQAPVKYYGNRLTSYGGGLHYTMQFTIDESAPWQYHLAEADVILQGGNMTVTNGRNYIRENQENKKKVLLEETQWYRLEEKGRYDDTVHVTRREFMELLFDLKRILIRATHHTAQDNVQLKDVLLDASSAGSTSDVSISAVEKCTCPRGYTGLSCESCDIGWRRVDNVLYGGTCVPCNCYGHSKTCDPYTGRCLMCVDNTMGENCEVCRPGFYGDPTRGNPDDCKPCACPLNEPSNNFATLCVAYPTFNEPDGFVCLDCEPGYTGDRCERCDNGYYGYPGLLGNYCQPCECNGNIDLNVPGGCDQLTGECKICMHNTMGKDCGMCRPGYHGTAVNGDCKLCMCDPFGSLNMTCDRWTGQCECKEHYTGRDCDRCESGYGDVTAGCTRCNCSRIGSLDYRCHPVTGQCVCRPGIAGTSCDRCEEGHYGYSIGGCYDCRCYLPGSNKTDICDVVTGECNCLPNVTGQYCDACKANFWGLELGGGCRPCDCYPEGSYFEQCDSQTGQCRCRPNIDGQRCDQCADGYYGLISQGECLECEPCDLPGHICHPDTGECVCPPNTMGDRCEQCIDTYWGYNPRTGCKPCACNPDGSLDNNCDPLSGQCACRADYEGDQCDGCLFGFYNFPDCQLCLCSVEGTEPDSCNSQGACQCGNQDGQCQCKENTVGRTCSQCANSSFSLDEENPSGCTDCFCFGRSQRCGQAPYVWSKVNLSNKRVSFNPLSNMYVRRHHGYLVIPPNTTWAGVGLDINGGEPVYWKLSEIIGDQTLSYGGHLKFTVQHGTVNGTELSNLEGLKNYPAVILVGYDYPLMHRVEEMWKKDSGMEIHVPLHEHYWRTRQNGDVSRDVMMIILQNITDVLVRATWDGNAAYSEISNISMDVAIESSGSLEEPALGIEQCQCPPEFSGLSCQNPADGYFRVPNVGPIDVENLIDFIGDVEKCQCFGHSSICDRETGICINCAHNTAGDNCQLCAPGYYGDATIGTASDCQRCACPLEVASNNPTCERIGSDLICTACEEGYSGNRCEFCASGYYGEPSTPGGKCRLCNCNLEGSVTADCDYTGRCECLPGITGVKCDQCQPRYAVVMGACVSCDEGCTRSLMADMDKIENMTAQLKFDPSDVNITLPVRKLNRIRNETRVLTERLQNMRLGAVLDLQEQLDVLSVKADDLDNQVEVLNRDSEESRKDAEALKLSAEEIESRINLLEMDVSDLVDDLVKNVESTFHNRSGVNVTASLEEAKRILAEIRARNFAMHEAGAQTESDLARDLSGRILFQNQRVTNTTSVEEKANDLMDRLKDLQDHVEKSIKISEKLPDKFDMLRDMIDRIKQLIGDMDGENETISDNNKEAEKLLMDAKDALNRTRENNMVLESRVSSLDSAMVPLKEKHDNLQDRLPTTEVLVNRAWEHANNLSDYANQLEKMFESTRTAAKDPVKAALVYENIVKAIEEASEAAKKAMDSVENATGMTDLDELNSAVSRSLSNSKDLLDRANETLNSGIGDLDKELQRLNKILDGVESQQIDLIGRHTDIKQAIDELPRDQWVDNCKPKRDEQLEARKGCHGSTDTIDRLSGIKDSLDNTDTKTKRVNSRTGDMVDKVNNELVPKLEELRALHDDRFEDVFVTLTGIDKGLADMKNLTDSLQVRYDKTQRVQSDLKDKLSKLKQSIREAREEANKVKTSLNCDGQCARKLRSVTKPGTLNTISFAFKTPAPEKPMVMVHIQSQKINDGDLEPEFLSVELINKKIQFSWNAGGGAATLTDDTEIQSESDILREVDKWYKVSATRIGRLGKLDVHPVTEAGGDIGTTSSAIGYSVMALDENADLYVAGIPANIDVPATVTRSNFTGCLGDLYIDGTLVGLANFETNTRETCRACLEVPAQPPGANIFSFDGTGYAVTDQERITSEIATSVSLEFKTFWPNASLFFVGNESTGEFFSLELLNRKLVLHYYLGQGSYGRLESENNYNIKSWVSVNVARNGEFGVLGLVGEPQKILQASKGDPRLSVQNADLYFGGIPPTVNTDVFKSAIYNTLGNPTIVTEPFLGCMKEIRISLSTINLWDGKSTVGVNEGCKQSGFRSIGFYGNGFAEYKGISLDSSEADLSASFTTLKPNGILLLAEGINGDRYYSLSIVDGKLEGRFSGGRRVVVLKSKERYNDGKVHNVAVRKIDRRLDMLIDDKQVDKGNLPQGGSEISVREDRGLYLGGVPDPGILGTMLAANQSLDGCISDVVIRGRVINFAEVQQYDKADIGRCRQPSDEIQNDFPVPVASDAPAEIRIRPKTADPTKETPPKPGSTRDGSDMMTGDMPAPLSPTTIMSPQSCAPDTGVYSFEKSTYNFGEEGSSYQQINITKKEVSRRFEIKFEFRTFIEDGLIFYLSNLDHTNFLAVQLKAGKLVVVYNRKSKVKEISVNSKTDVIKGEWHSVYIKKNRQRLNVGLDGQNKKGGKIAKVLKMDVPIYVGGVPETFLPLLNDKVISKGIHGCLRRTTFNNNRQTFTPSVNGKSNCFKDIQKGAYFTGNSFAVIDDNFVVGRELTVDIEFRTTKPEGILATVNNVDGNHAMTLELSKGQIMFSIISRKRKLSVSSKFDSPFTLCDNQWHAVKAQITKNSIALQLDNKEAYVTNSDQSIKKIATNSPLYIGGVPDPRKPASATTTQGFTGCLRNVIVTGKPVDWTSIPRSVDVRRTACPVS